MPTMPPPGGPPTPARTGVAALWGRYRALPTGVQAVGWVLLALSLLVGAGASSPGVVIADVPETPAGAASAGSDGASPSDADPAPGDERSSGPGPDPAPAPDLEAGSGSGSGPAETEDGDTAASAAPGATATLDGDLEVHFLDIGQGDATLLKHAEATILIDTGRHQASDVVPSLTAAGVDAVDLVIVTHPHADHIGQFDQVLDRLPVREVWWSGSTTTSQTFGRALTALERSDAAYEEPRAGDTALIGPLEVEVVNPPAGVGLQDLHDANLAVRVTYGEVRFLFTGDAEAATEGRMVSRSGATLDADILQLGHHGSNTSTTAGFLAAVDPAIAIYSASADNQYGHPHAEVLDRLATAGVEVYGTAVHGTVTVTTDGRDWSVSTHRSGTPQPGARPSSNASRDGNRSSGGPASPSPSPTTSASPSAPSSDACGPGQVDINRAGADELQRIIHIGPDRARQMPGLRPFASVRSMDRISGIGPARLEDILAEGLACAG
jgi:competence protein ComEC